MILSFAVKYIVFKSLAKFSLTYQKEENSMKTSKQNVSTFLASVGQDR